MARAILGQGATPELIANVRERLGLDEPAHLRYFTWMGNLLAGRLGTSLANSADIADMIGERIVNTMLLAGVTAALAVPLAVGLGLLCALKPNGAVDRAISTVSLTLISVPDFLVAIVLVTIFAVPPGLVTGHRQPQARAGSGGGRPDADAAGGRAPVPPCSPT